MKLIYRASVVVGSLTIVSGIALSILSVKAQGADLPCYMIDSSGDTIDLGTMCQNNEESVPSLDSEEVEMQRDVTRLHMQASDDLAEGNFQAAIDGYTQALQIQPNSAGSYLLRGIAYREKGDGQLAAEDFQQASQLFNDQGDERMARAVQSQLDRLQHQD